MNNTMTGSTQCHDVQWLGVVGMMVLICLVRAIVAWQGIGPGQVTRLDGVISNCASIDFFLIAVTNIPCFSFTMFTLGVFLSLGLAFISANVFPRSLALTYSPFVAFLVSFLSDSVLIRLVMAHSTTLRSGFSFNTFRVTLIGSFSCFCFAINSVSYSFTYFALRPKTILIVSLFTKVRNWFNFLAPGACFGLNWLRHSFTFNNVMFKAVRGLRPTGGLYYCIALFIIVNAIISPVLAVSPAITTFNGGEWSPFMLRRFNFAKYDSACQELTNMLILTEGPVQRRPGTKFIAAVKDPTTAVRLIPFEQSKTDAYIIETGPRYMRFYRNGGQIINDDDSIFELDTEFGEEDLVNIQYVQDASVMYFVDGNDAPQKLTRADHNDWTIEDMNFITGPFLDENTTTTVVEPNALTGTIRLIADANIFEIGHEGALWRIGFRRSDTPLIGTLDANESSAAIEVSGTFYYNIQGTWSGDAILEKSFDSGSSYETVYPRYNSSTAVNEDFDDSEPEEDVLYRITMSNYVSGAAEYYLRPTDNINYGIVRIIKYVDPNEVQALVLSTLQDANSGTDKWSEGAWSTFRGFPQTIEFYEQRLMFGGSASFPQTIWATKTANGSIDDYENMTAGVDDDDALIYVLPGQNPIQWLKAQTQMLIGTLAGVGRWGSQDDETAITPTNPTNYREQARHGAKYMQSIIVGDSVLYVERGGHRIREFAYSLERDRYVAPDLTILAEHITGDGVVDMAYQGRPDSILWCVTADGTLSSLTYQRTEDVVGWARHIMGPSSPATTGFPSPVPSTAAALSLTRTTAISNVDELQAMNDDLTDNYYLINDIDCAVTEDWNSGDGFVPIGNVGTKFTGTFDGQGFTISNLFIDRSTENRVGLFGFVQSATLYDFILADSEIHGDGLMGAVIGEVATAVTAQNITVRDTIIGGGSQMGGFVGAGATGTFTECETKRVTVQNDASESYANVGLFNGTCNGTFTDCRANGDITETASDSGVGITMAGFVAQMDNTDVFIRCEASGTLPNPPTSVDRTLFRTGTFGGFGGTFVSGATTTDCKFQKTLDFRAVAGTDEKQSVLFTNPDPTGGTYTLTFDNITTPAINFDALQAAIQSAFDTAFGADVIDVEDTPNSTLGVYFRGDNYTRTDVAAITLDMSNLTGGSGAYTVIESTKGAYAEPNPAPTATVVSETIPTTGHNSPGDGAAISVAVIPGTDEDEVWVIVRRDVNDNILKYIEQIQPRDYGDDQKDAFFVDSGLSFDGGDAVSITAATKAEPPLITVDTWPTDGSGTNLADGQEVKIVGVVGMTELNNAIFTIDDADVSAKTLTLDNSTGATDINAVDYTTYISGGTLQRFERNFTGANHLDTETVIIFTDGQAAGSAVVGSDGTVGTVDTDIWGNKVHIGLPYTSIVKTMPIIIPEPTGISVGKVARINSVTIDFYKTLGVSYGQASDNLTPVVFYARDADPGTPIPFKTGLIPQPFLFGYSRDAIVYMESAEPYPWTLRMIAPNITISER